MRNIFNFRGNKKINPGENPVLYNQTIYLSFCPNIREMNKMGNSQHQTKKYSSIGKNKQDDKLNDKVKTMCFRNESINTQTLQYKHFWFGGQEIETLIDSIAEIPINNLN